MLIINFIRGVVSMVGGGFRLRPRFEARFTFVDYVSLR